MYSVHDYGTMIADRVRMDCYSQALRLAVRPGSVVLDLGAGTGIFALLACRFGAERVYAVEPDTVIQVAREVAAANGYGDRIVFLQQRSDQIELPERVNVVISDLRGVLPWFGDHLSTIADTRKRFLTSGGTLIGKRDTVWAAVVEAPELHDSHFAGCQEAPLGFDQGPVRRILANKWRQARLRPEHLLTEPSCISTLDYESGTASDLSVSTIWRAARSGTAHGLLVWFDALLVDGVGFSNAPGKPEAIYGSAFFPWFEPVPLEPADTVRVTIEARLMGGDYVWAWNSSVCRAQERRAAFYQTTLLGDPLAPATFRRLALEYKAALGEDGRIDCFILGAMNGRASLGTIARRVLARYPKRFGTLKSAMVRVGELSSRYARYDSQEFGNRNRKPPVRTRQSAS